MKTNVQETSLLPRLPECQEKVLDLFWESIHEDFERDWTNQEIAKKLGWEICSVTGRVHDLRAKGYLYFNRKRICKITGNKVMAWRSVI